MLLHLLPSLAAAPRVSDLHPWFVSTDLRRADKRDKLNQLMPACIRRNANSQHWEDRMVFLPLRCMREGAPGTFVELGAFTGVRLSNSVMLERCFDWTGVLIEGSPANFKQLSTSGRKATMVHFKTSTILNLHLFV